MIAKIWRRQSSREIVYQLLVVVALMALGGYFFSNATTNLEQQGIASGFGFFDNPAGFDIILHLIDYSEQSSYGRAFVVGLLNTLLVSLLGIMIASVLGLLIGLARLSDNWLVAKISALYIEIFRNIPLLLQIFFWYFAVLRTLPHPRQSIELGHACALNIRGLYCPKPIFTPDIFPFVLSLILAVVFGYGLALYAKRRQRLTGQQWSVLMPTLILLVLLITACSRQWGLPFYLDYPVLKGFNFHGGFVIIPELTALLLALSIYTAAFIAEIVRAGILAVPKGQSEAAASLGLKRSLVIRFVVLPQALRVIIPPLTSQYLNLTKNSSLAAAIAYPDLISVFAGTVLNQTGQAIEVIGITMAVYLTISLTISTLMNLYNRRMALVER